MMMLTKKREETFRVTLSWKDHDKDHVYEAAVTLQSLLLNQQDFSVQKPKEYGNSGQVLARKKDPSSRRFVAFEPVLRCPFSSFLRKIHPDL